MPSGYEKSPDYGSEPPGWSFVAFMVLVFVIGPALAYWTFGRAPPKCWELGQDELTITEVDGKQRATLDLRRIPKGECVTIKP